VQGQAILYGDNLTDSMARAIEETETPPGDPAAIQPGEWHYPPRHYSPQEQRHPLVFWRCLVASMYRSLRRSMSKKMTSPWRDIPELIGQLEKQMKEAAKNLEFEEAAKYRDRIKTLRDQLLGKRSPVAE
jgi:excinuclease ABC subunit B